jgi:arylsulfatase
MNRREFLGPLAVTALGLPSTPAAARKTQLNIVLILTDDQGYGDLACHGNPIIKTPHLDRLHHESVRFTDFHASPTCAPTRASLMTGRHEFKSGVTHTILERERLSLRAVTIAQVLRSAGYATGIFGKWHLGDSASYQPNRRGFDEAFIHGCGGIGQSYPGTCGDAPGNSYVNPVILHNGVFEKTQGYCTDVFFGQAAKWIEEKRQARAPFFAYITPNAPHAPLVCPPQYEALYKGLPLDEPVAKFYGMITNIDDNVGKLLGRLREWGLERDTLVIFMTDNGTATGAKVFNAGMRGQKNTPYQGGTRVPAFFRWPGTLKPADVDKLTAHLDIFPTLVELAGAKVPDAVRLDGRSLAPLLKDPNAQWPDRFLFTHIGRWEPGQAAQSKYARCRVRSSRFSLVSLGRGEKTWELYDLNNDPGETKDVAAQFPEAVKEMDAAYDRWWEEILPCLENENAVGPKVNPFKELFWKQFGGGPATMTSNRGHPLTALSNE